MADPNTQTKQLRMRLEEVLKRLETNSGGIYIRWQDPDTGKYVNTSLDEMETGAAIQQVCRFIRQAVED